MDLRFPSQTPGPCALPHEGSVKEDTAAGSVCLGQAVSVHAFPLSPPPPHQRSRPVGCTERLGGPKGCIIVVEYLFPAAWLQKQLFPPAFLPLHLLCFPFL